MDYTIELWSTDRNTHCVECTCGWFRSGTRQDEIEDKAWDHKRMHEINNDSAEVV